MINNTVIMKHIMKKIFLALALLSVLTLNAQTTSRIMIGVGGGLSTNRAKGNFDNLCNGMGTFNFGYYILGAVSKDAKIGLRTGLGATYGTLANSARLDQQFTNVDYYGYHMDYTVTSKSCSFKQSQLNLDVPVMLSIHARGLYVNLGAKLVIPVWNKYTQTISDPQISATYREIGVTVVNDVVTGKLTDAQMNMSGKAAMPSLMIGLGAEIGHVWQLGNSNSSLGFDLFVDYCPWNIGGAKDNAKSVVEVAPIVNDCEQPQAAVAVNPLNGCNGFIYRPLNFGIKLVYTFDIEHTGRTNDVPGAY